MENEEVNEKEQVEINENALIEHITEEIEENDFDYSDVTDEEKEKLLEIKMRKGIIVQGFINAVGKDLSEAQKIYSKNGNGKFSKWVEEEYGISRTTAFNYLKAYEVWNNCSLEGTIDITKLEKIGVKKLASLSKLSEEQQKDVIENAPLEELNVKQVEELTKQVKIEQEYSEELVEELKKKDEKIREKTELQKQQDNQIKELQQKIEELENIEIEEKIVEVEKVIEKEVVPEHIKVELETYKKLAKENMEEIPDYILDEIDSLRKTVQEKEELLENAERTVEAVIQKRDIIFGRDSTDWNELGKAIYRFLECASKYTYLNEAYKKVGGVTKHYVITAVDKLEKWLISMKKLMNKELMIGNYIIVENEETTGGTTTDE